MFIAYYNLFYCVHDHLSCHSSQLQLGSIVQVGYMYIGACSAYYARWMLYCTLGIFCGFWPVAKFSLMNFQILNPPITKNFCELREFSWYTVRTLYT